KPSPRPYPTLPGWLFGAAFLTYLLMPQYWIHVDMLYKRLPMLVMLLFPMIIPRANVVAEKVVAIVVAGVGLRCGTAFLELRRAQLPAWRDLVHVIDEAPPGRRLAINVPYTNLAEQTHPWAGHLAPYYVARKGLEAAASYSDVPANPLRYRGDPPALAPA